LKIIIVSLPKWFNFEAFTIKPFVFISSKVKIPVSGSLLRHEQVHLDQQERLGILKMLWQYFTSKQKRMEFEIEAFLAQGLGDVEIISRLQTKYSLEFTSSDIQQAIELARFSK
jgi:hypothetical protein